MAVGISFVCKLVRAVELLSPLTASVYSLLSVAAAKLVGISDATISKQQRNASTLPNRFDIIENPPFFDPCAHGLPYRIHQGFNSLLHRNGYNSAFIISSSVNLLLFHPIPM